MNRPRLPSPTRATESTERVGWPGASLLLFLLILALTVSSLSLLSRAFSRIEANLPLASLHRERDFSALLLDVSRLETALRVATALPTPEHVGQVAFSLDLAVLRLRDNQSLYRDAELSGMTAFQTRFEQLQQRLEATLGGDLPDAMRLNPFLAETESLRLALQGLNDRTFQSSMQRASAQQHDLERLDRALSFFLLLLGGLMAAILYFVLRQRRLLKAQGAREARLRESEAGYQRIEMELRRSNAELEQFAYAISHDMRQPLRMIASYQQLLEKALNDRLDDETREYLGYATDGARRLDQMLMGLLDYSRIGRKTEPLDWIPGREALDEALRYLRPAIEEARAQVRVEGDWPRLHASHDELVRLFQNLIGNAVKYRVTTRDPDIEVSGKLSGAHWTVTVSDNGIGIDPGQIPRLFQVFQRLQSRARYDGAGVGLALCRKIVEHHGGHIHAESEGEDRGSTFVFELPLSGQSPGRAGNDPTPEPGTQTATPPPPAPGGVHAKHRSTP